MIDTPQPRRTGIPSDDFLTIEDLMEALQVSRATVTSMVQSGRLPPPLVLSKRGKRLRDVVW